MTTPPLPTRTLRTTTLAVEQLKALSLAPVEVTTDTATPIRLPVLLLDVTNPAPVANGRPEWAAAFRMTVTAMHHRRAAALDLAHDAVDGILAAWRAGTTTPHGAFSHVTVTTLPYLSTPRGTGADDVWAFTAVLDVVARHYQHTP